MPGSKRPTLVSIATELGLSPSTVGFVLRGQAQTMHINPGTARRVREAAKRLGYVPNQLARGLRKRQTGVIGLVLPDLSLNWSDLIYQGMMTVLDEEGWIPLILLHRWNPERQARDLDKLVQQQVDAIICSPIGGRHDLYRAYANSRIPFLLLGDTLDGLEEVSFVGWDSENAAAAVTRHLLEQGCQRLAFIGPDHPTVMSRRRRDIFETIVLQAGLHLHDRWIASVPNLAWAPGLTDQWTRETFGASQEHPDGIFALNDAIAVLLLESLGKAGVRVPDDVLVASIGNLPMTGMEGVNLTTAEEPVFEMGREAAHAVVGLIKGEMTTPHQQWVQKTNLIIRRSTQRTTPPTLRKETSLEQI